MSKIDVVAGMIEKDGKLFAARRKQGKAMGGYWELPGGKIEEGEDAKDALKRELKEELGIDTLVKVYFSNNLWQGDTALINLIAFKVDYLSGDIELIDHDAYRWLDISELDDIQWAPADVPIIEKYKQSNNMKNKI